MSYITAIGTAVPSNRFTQLEIADFMARSLELDESEKRKLIALYRSTKIQYRHSVLPDYGLAVDAYQFYPRSQNLEPFPSVAQRMEVYKQTALPLCLEAVKGLPLDGVTHLITVSCTGMYAPGLDIELVQALNLSGNIRRTAINFMGCYGAFNGLKVANDICLAHPTAKVLLVSVELCTLHFQKKKDLDFLLSNALFSDGAAAVIIESHASHSKVLKLESFFCDLFTEGRSDMAWHIADFGFEMTLTSYVPQLIKKGINLLVENLLQSNGTRRDEIKYYAIHPGGRAILESVELALGISTTDNQYAYEVLRDYGNMSSTTIIFVLKKVLELVSDENNGCKVLSCAFGPGLTVESLIAKMGV
ncbi:type III polyketide synthase [Flectobacillus longus]|uniref:type III polyketide synthase n=1 Tax=Flectobacillus longus TaxID=2984207 RepID=UPI0024B64D4D|nr:type III polyketide synthase [Flectobacillus longus]MDI9882620.1 type III polyketide synthase [Flectobacillus longus]